MSGPINFFPNASSLTNPFLGQTASSSPSLLNFSSIFDSALRSHIHSSDFADPHSLRRLAEFSVKSPVQNEERPSSRVEGFLKTFLNKPVSIKEASGKLSQAIVQEFSISHDGRYFFVVLDNEKRKRRVKVSFEEDRDKEPLSATGLPSGFSPAIRLGVEQFISEAIRKSNQNNEEDAESSLGTSTGKFLDVGLLNLVNQNNAEDIIINTPLGEKKTKINPLSQNGLYLIDGTPLKISLESAEL